MEDVGVCILCHEVTELENLVEHDAGSVCEQCLHEYIDDDFDDIEE